MEGRNLSPLGDVASRDLRSGKYKTLPILILTARNEEEMPSSAGSIRSRCIGYYAAGPADGKARRRVPFLSVP
jgi:hypothetical protein